MTKPYRLVEAPSILGLSPDGVELLPAALLRNGFLEDAAIPPSISVPIDGSTFNPARVSRHAVLNAAAIADYSIRLAQAVGEVLQQEQFPVVLGGDCSILLGCMLALKRQGRFGLFHVDAHADFYQPEAEPKGEAASMDLALVSGRGPEALTNLEGRKPYVLDEDIVQIGQRDAAEADQAGSRRLQDSPIRCFDLETVRKQGIDQVVEQAVTYLSDQPIEGFWIHFDVDVLADEIMPAVDYRIPGGLSFEEAVTVLRTLRKSPKAIGLTITIFNPKLDSDGMLTQKLVSCLQRGLLG